MTKQIKQTKLPDYEELLSALEAAHSHLCLKSIDGDNSGYVVQRLLAYTICKARGEA